LALKGGIDHGRKDTEIVALEGTEAKLEDVREKKDAIERG